MTEAEAIAAWNRRAPAQPEPAAPTVVEPNIGGSSYEASMLRGLLCLIHRDGGHYLHQHGIDKAVADAEEVLFQWRTAFDAATPPRAAQDESEIDRLRLCEQRLAAVTKWLELNQPDVFRRGLWDAVFEAGGPRNE